jgi:hypothetical protein
MRRLFLLIVLSLGCIVAQAGRRGMTRLPGGWKRRSFQSKFIQLNPDRRCYPRPIEKRSGDTYRVSLHRRSRGWCQVPQ